MQMKLGLGLSDSGLTARRLSRVAVLVALMAIGSLSIVAAAYQQPPAAPAGPRVNDILKLKDNLYVLTSSTPGNAATFSPGCDRNNGGSCISFPQTLAKVVATITDIDTVIPGHSPMMTPKDLQEYQQFTADLAAHAQAASTAGTSVDEATAAFKVDKYPGYKSERIKASIQAVYDELGK